MVFCERAFIEGHVGVGVSASRAFTVACARRGGGHSLAYRHGRKNFNRAATCVSTVKSYVRFGVKCGIGALTNVH
jgi:hypothetical protein